MVPNGMPPFEYQDEIFSKTLGSTAEEKTDEQKLAAEILNELTRARKKFPGKNVTFLALVEEVGELATAMFEEGRENVKKEAIQVACMAMRIVLDGDHTIDNWRNEKGLDALIDTSKEKAVVYILKNEYHLHEDMIFASKEDAFAYCDSKAEFQNWYAEEGVVDSEEAYDVGLIWFTESSPSIPTI